MTKKKPKPREKNVTYQAYIKVPVDKGHGGLPWKPVGNPQKDVDEAVVIAQSATGNNQPRKVLRQEPHKEDIEVWNTKNGYL